MGVLPDSNLFYQREIFEAKKGGVVGQIRICLVTSKFYSVIIHKFMEYLTPACSYVNFDPISPPLMNINLRETQFIAKSQILGKLP